MNRMPLAFNDVAVGEALPSLVKPITLVNMVVYAAAVWDFIPLHFDRDYAQRRGLPQPCVDGQMLGAFLAQVVTDWIGEAGTVKTLTFRLREFVYPGDTLTCKGRVINKRAQDGEYLLDCKLWIENQMGVKVVTPARATVALLSQA